MKASKFTKSLIAFVVRQGEEGTSVEEVCRKAGLSHPDVLQLEEEVRRADAV